MAGFGLMKMIEAARDDGSLIDVLTDLQLLIRATLDEMGFDPSGFGFLPFDGCGHLMLWSIEGGARQLPRMDAARCSAYGGNGGCCWVPKPTA
ncbi:hypothetical protein ACLOJK_036854 [Asimina triloba]